MVMRRLLSLCLPALALFAHAQTINVDHETAAHWEWSLTGGFNTDGWQWDTGVAYFPTSTVGVKMSIGMAGEIGEINWGGWEDDYYGDTYFDHYTWRFKFIPALVLRSPRLFCWKNSDTGFYLFAEPGLVLSPGAEGSHGAKTFRYDMRGGVNIQADRCIISLGYEWTNFSLYSGHPYSDQNTSGKDNYITHGGFLGFAYKF